ncbi:MAG: hypothetical protein ABGZ17_28905, partial [Planctomycetaceae bacterium]
SALYSNRVDVGVFVHNGPYYSAPGFLSIFSLANEKRTYDDQQRVIEVDYADPKTMSNYVDPLLSSAKNWRDVYSYDQRGRLAGWTRHRAERNPESFTRDGLLVTQRDALGRVTTAMDVQYALQPMPGQIGQLNQVNGGREFFYDYQNEKDTYGKRRQGNERQADGVGSSP